MTIHIGANTGDIAETVLLPGDPYRAKWAAETFLSEVRQINNVRGMLGFTGLWNTHPVTIQGSGMGMPSLSIYVNELIRDYDAKTLIRVGSCGAMQKNIAVRDIIIAMTASTLSTPSRGIFKELNFAPCADWSLLRAAVADARRCKQARKQNRPHTGNRKCPAGISYDDDELKINPPTPCQCAFV